VFIESFRAISDLSDLPKGIMENPYLSAAFLYDGESHIFIFIPARRCLYAGMGIQAMYEPTIQWFCHRFSDHTSIWVNLRAESCMLDVN
jgi:hypothetical protein